MEVCGCPPQIEQMHNENILILHGFKIKYNSFLLLTQLLNLNVVIVWFIVHWKKYFDNQNYIHAIFTDHFPTSTTKHWNLRQWSPRLGQRRPRLWGSKGRNISASPLTIQIGTSTIRLSWYHFSPWWISLWACEAKNQGDLSGKAVTMGESMLKEWRAPEGKRFGKIFIIIGWFSNGLPQNLVGAKKIRELCLETQGDQQNVESRPFNT